MSVWAVRSTQVVNKRNSPRMVWELKQIPDGRWFKVLVARCHYCGEEPRLGEVYHWDHFVARSRGGRDTERNLVLACPTCNLVKGDKTIKKARIALLRKRFGWLTRGVDPARLSHAKLYFEEVSYE